METVSCIRPLLLIHTGRQMDEPSPTVTQWQTRQFHDGRSAKVGENMGIREHKQIIEKVQETVSHWLETAKDCGVKPEHADFIGKNLLLFGKQPHTIQMPNIVNEQEQTFIKAMRDDDFNTILELKMKGYQPSENVLKKPSTGYILHHLHRCRQNISNGKNAKKYLGHKACAKPTYRWK